MEVIARRYGPLVAPVLLLVAVGLVGYVAFLAFVRGILQPKEFATYGLVATAVVAGAASFFSPCNFTVLPAYLSFTGTGGPPGTRRLSLALRNGAAAGLGIATAVVALGLVIAAVGTGVGPKLSIFNPELGFVGKTVRVALGLFIAALGVVQLANLSHRLPLVRAIVGRAVQMGGPPQATARSAFLFGVGYVAVGVG